MHASNNDPLHGLTLEAIVTALVDRYGFKALSRQIEIRCFYHEPSVKSSLKFLRKTPWARTKVEELYINTFSDKKNAKKRTPSSTSSAQSQSQSNDDFQWPTLNS